MPVSKGRCVAVMIVALTLALHAGSVQAGARTDKGVYFVAPGGSDTSPGTELLPWRTIQRAADSMPPGSTCIVLPGTYRERVIVSQTGSELLPIAFRAQGSVRTRGFTLLGDYIEISGFEISDTPDDWRDGWGIFVRGSHCIIQHNNVHFATRGGITVFADPREAPMSEGCSIVKNRCYRNAMVGIEIHGRGHVVEGNDIWGTIQYHPSWANPPSWVDADGIRLFGAGHLIRHNHIHDISYRDAENVNPHVDCFQTWSDESHQAASGVVIEQNLCENLEFNTAYENGQGFMLRGATNLIIRNNIVRAFRHVNAFDCRNLTIVDNVFTSDPAFMRFDPFAIGLARCTGGTLRGNILWNVPWRILHADTESLATMDIERTAIDVGAMVRKAVW